jgi:hypothetical protein
MSSDPARIGPREMASRLLAREAPAIESGEPEIVGAALQRACRRAIDTLRDSMGEEGCDALLARAFARAEPAHPALKDIRPVNGVGLRLDGIVATSTTRGPAEVNAAVEALLAALVDVLARLIGEEMAIQLMDHDGPSLHRDIGAAP